MFRRRPRGLVPSIFFALATVMLGLPVRPQAGQDPLPTARALVDRAVDVSGGAAAFKAVKSTRMKGTISIPDQNMSGDIEVLSARPNKVIMRATIAAFGQIEEGFDGKVGWSINPMTGPALVTGKALEQRAEELWFDAPLHAPDHVRDMTVAGRETFDQRPAYRVKVVMASGAEQTEFFDVDSGQQIGIEATHETPMGPAPTRTMFRDFKKFGAMTMPTTQVERIMGLEQIVTATSVEFNVVPATAFDLPPRIKALIK
jgi:hypothetical protein